MDLVIDIGNKGIMTFAPGILEPIVSLAVSYCGDLAAGEIVLKPLRSFRRPLADTIRAMPYVQMQSLSGIGPLAELGALLGSDDSRTGFIERLSEQAIDIIIASCGAPSYFWVNGRALFARCDLPPSAESRGVSPTTMGFLRRNADRLRKLINSRYASD